jgi:hypothetical protein
VGLVFGAALVEYAPRPPQDERVADGRVALRSRLPKRACERPAFEAQPIPSLHHIEMFIQLLRGSQPELLLDNAVEQLVEEYLPGV